MSNSLSCLLATCYFDPIDVDTSSGRKSLGYFHLSLVEIGFMIGSDRFSLLSSCLCKIESRMWSSQLNLSYCMERRLLAFKLFGNSDAKLNVTSFEYLLTYLILGTAFTWKRLRRHPWLQPRPELPLLKLDGPAPRLSRSSSSPGSTV